MIPFVNDCAPCRLIRNTTCSVLKTYGQKGNKRRNGREKEKEEGKWRQIVCWLQAKGGCVLSGKTGHRETSCLPVLKQNCPVRTFDRHLHLYHGLFKTDVENVRETDRLTQSNRPKDRLSTASLDFLVSGRKCIAHCAG